MAARTAIHCRLSLDVLKMAAAVPGARKVRAKSDSRLLTWGPKRVICSAFTSSDDYTGEFDTPVDVLVFRLRERYSHGWRVVHQHMKPAIVGLMLCDQHEGNGHSSS